ncbi:MAG: hypothetical protein GYB49_08105 [Alphaproteobacteria bacterium]|nr:hypothetical protein [Alphaproteobacteria bacterium]
MKVSGSSLVIAPLLGALACNSAQAQEVPSTDMMCDGVFMSEETGDEEIYVPRFAVILSDGTVEISGASVFDGLYEIYDASPSEYAFALTGQLPEDEEFLSGSVNRLDGTISLVRLYNASQIWTHRLDAQCQPMRQLF